MSLTDAQTLLWSAIQPGQLSGLNLSLIDASGPILAAASFLLTIAFGGAFLRRSRGWIDDAVEASIARPLSSLLYGFMAYVITAFIIGYAASQLARLGVDTLILTFVGGGVLAILVLSFCGIGFVVLGTWVTELLGERDPWSGLVGVAAAGAVVWLVLPVELALLLWLAIAAVGLGGPTRQWIHEPDVDPGNHR